MNIDVIPVHVIPSSDVAILVVLPQPVATNKDPFHATPFPPETENGEVLVVQVVPSGDVAIVFVP